MTPFEKGAIIVTFVLICTMFGVILFPDFKNRT